MDQDCVKLGPLTQTPFDGAGARKNASKAIGCRSYRQGASSFVRYIWCIDAIYSEGLGGGWVGEVDRGVGWIWVDYASSWRGSDA